MGRRGRSTRADGLPTQAGVLLHALVFVLLSSFLWKLFYGKKM